jgi:hypothetical protein
MGLKILSLHVERDVQDDRGKGRFKSLVDAEQGFTEDSVGETRFSIYHLIKASIKFH